jgi:hypothetical protein
VIEVGMGEHNSVESLHIDGRRRPVAQAQLLEALEKAAVDQDARAVAL